MAIRLTIPKQLPDRELSIGADAAAFAAWLASLPQAQDDLLAQRLLPVLIEANRIEFDSGQRLELLNRLRAVVEPLLLALRTRTRQAVLHGMDPKTVQRIAMLRRLIQEMAYGYKIAIIDFLRTGAGELHQHAVAMHGAMHYLGDALLEHYAFYEPVTSNLWGELNLIYRLALREKLEKLSLSFTVGGKSSIDLIYKRLAIVAAINPYRLQRGEADKVYALVASWCASCELMVREPGWIPKGEVVINLAGDDPPSHIRPGTKLLDVSSVRVLDTSKVQVFMQQTLEALDTATAQGSEDRFSLQLQYEMLKRLSEGWQGEASRSSSRISNQVPMEMVFGLTNAYTQCREAEKGRGIDELSFANLSLVPINELQGSHMAPGGASPFKIDDPHRSVWADSATRVGASDLEQGKPPTIYPVTRVDVSEGGYGLQVAQEVGLQVRVGDLVLLRPLGIGMPWAVADIRWKRAAQDGAVAFGVRLLSVAATPFEIVVVKGRGMGSRPAGGLLVPADGFDHPEARLIVPAAVYGEGSELRLWSLHDKVIVKLTEQLESSDGFARFSYRILRRITGNSVL